MGSESSGTKAWSHHMVDDLDAEVSVTRFGRGIVFVGNLPLRTAVLYEEGGWLLDERPPYFLAELLEKAWQWSQAVTMDCVPAGESL